MSLFNPIRKDIIRIGSFVSGLDHKLYVQPLPVISGASVGQHVRHILEFYACILLECNDNLVCYDGRKRDRAIETDSAVAVSVTQRLTQKLKEILLDKKVNVQANYAGADAHDVYLTSTLFRELAYALDHSIHHQAILKIGLTGIPEVAEKINDLGVAPSTLRYRQLLNKR